jgi:hypothetical protein
MAAANVLDERVPGGDYLCTAELFEARLHDARHTTATVLLVLGINQHLTPGPGPIPIWPGRLEALLH